MSLIFTRAEFIECPTCRAKPGSPALCTECLERREMHMLLKRKGLLDICPRCNGTPDPNCPKHGR